MGLNLELNLIKLIQSVFFTENYNIIDMTAKFISSRKYKIYFITIYFIFLVLTRKTINEYIVIPKLYIFGYLSRILNIQIKLLFKRKRPYVVDNNVLVLEKSREKKKDTFSLPSNSIQTSLIFYGFLLRQLNLNRYLSSLILGVIVFITSFAKINRGMHYPTDIILSILIYHVTIIIYSKLLTVVVDYYGIDNIYK